MSAIKNSDMSIVNGRYVAYRYYGDTSSTFDHGGVVVLASHHDAEKRTVYCGVCVIPKHVCIKHGESVLEFVPHKYDRRAARAIATSRLDFAVTGKWDSEIDKLISKYATWAPKRRMPTESEVAERTVSFEGRLRAIASTLTEEQIKERVESYISKMTVEGILDIPSPEVFHRSESSFVVHYAEDAFEGEVTRDELDDLIVETLQKQIEDRKLPRWVNKVIVPDFDVDGDVSDEAVIHIVSGESENGKRTFAIGRVDFDSDDSPIGIDYVGPSFKSLKSLGDFVNALSATYEETMNDTLPIVRVESLEDPDDETYEYASEYVGTGEDDEDGEDDGKDDVLDGGEEELAEDGTLIGDYEEDETPRNKNN